MEQIEINGVQLGYLLESGEKEETMVFLNGIAANYLIWSSMAKFFKQMGYHVLLHDFRGQLFSSKPKEEYSYKQHADDLNKLVDHFDLKKIHFVATSYGGLVAQQYLIDYPENVSSLTLIDSLSEMDATMRFRSESSGHRILQAKTGDREKYYQFVFLSIYGDKYISENYDQLLEMAKKGSFIPDDYFDSMHRLYQNFVKNAYYTDQLDKIKVPTLIIHGEEDQIVHRRCAEILNEKIENSEFFMVPYAGHVPFIEFPGLVNSAVLGFVKKQELSE